VLIDEHDAETTYDTSRLSDVANQTGCKYVDDEMPTANPEEITTAIILLQEYTRAIYYAQTHKNQIPWRTLDCPAVHCSIQ